MNKQIKFLLINPTAPEWRIHNKSRPFQRSRMFRFSMLTSLAVAASLPNYVDVRIVDEETEELDFNAEVDIVGISCMTFNSLRGYEIADIFRNIKKKKVIMGGFHPTFMPEEAIQHCDAVCIGEAEPNLPLIIEDFLQGELKQFYQNGYANMGTVKIPDRTLISRKQYLWANPLQATRGCRNQCTFCSITAFYNNTYRYRPIENVIAELKTLSKYILFIDDNLTTDIEYAKELFRQMIPLKKKWSSQCSISITRDQELLDLAVQSGCIGLFIGFESINQHNLDGWKKECNYVIDYSKSIEALHYSGIGVYAGIVLGTDKDNREVFNTTLDFLFKNNVEALQATIMTPFPGTPLFKQLENEGRIIDKNWAHYDFKHVVFEPQQMSSDELLNGHKMVLKEFYSKQNIFKRVIKQHRYLPFKTIMMASLPLNLSYRFRLEKNGIFS